MTKGEAKEVLQEVKHYLTAGNPVWDVNEIAEACDMAIEALGVNCVKCNHYSEVEDDTGVKSICNAEQHVDPISRSRAIKEMSYWATDILHPQNLIREDAIYILESLPSADAVEVVRCKDCKHRYGDECPMRHVEWVTYDDDGYIEWDDVVQDNTMDDMFCNCGEREDGEDA